VWSNLLVGPWAELTVLLPKPLVPGRLKTLYLKTIAALATNEIGKLLKLPTIHVILLIFILVFINLICKIESAELFPPFSLAGIV
jgi:hypothetical protein